MSLCFGAQAGVHRRRQRATLLIGPAPVPRPPGARPPGQHLQGRHLGQLAGSGSGDGRGTPMPPRESPHNCHVHH